MDNENLMNHNYFLIEIRYIHNNNTNLFRRNKFVLFNLKINMYYNYQSKNHNYFIQNLYLIIVYLIHLMMILLFVWKIYKYHWFIIFLNFFFFLISFKYFFKIFIKK